MASRKHQEPPEQDTPGADGKAHDGGESPASLWATKDRLGEFQTLAFSGVTLTAAHPSTS